MSPPRATVRLQLHKEFDFDAAREVVPYYADLGISHYYLSPILAARAGSMHGYDGIDPTRINPELGDRDAYVRLVDTLRAHRMGVILDIVPNHLAASIENPWWRDLLVLGRGSRYADFFDIDWSPSDPAMRDCVVLPALDAPLDTLLPRARIERDGDTAWLDLDGLRLPLSPMSSAETPSDEAQWQALFDAQHWRLVPWREAGRRINWRRFFDVGELVALRAERDEVFEATHALPLALVADGLADGLRIDHIDGLTDPRGYCERLAGCFREAASRRPAHLANLLAGLYVEKILAHDEALPPDWPIDGTTGYEFMDQVSAVLHDDAGIATLDRLWQTTADDDADAATIARCARRELLDGAFAADTARLAATVADACPAHAGNRIDAALRVLLLYVDRYRAYEGDDTALDRAIAAASEAAPDCAPILRDLRPVLADGLPALRFRQLTPALAAKSIEDTMFYRYGRLISRNEVGASPAQLALPLDAFHAAMQARRRDWPDALLATATHDHKRGEDVRARLAVLSERAELWDAFLHDWRLLGALDGIATPGPDAVDTYFLLQTLVGCWPMHDTDGDSATTAEFCERVVAWQRKALREGKRRSSWHQPDLDYEQACESHLRHLLGSPHAAQQRVLLRGLVARIAPAGAINGLVQTVLRLTCPGVPDLYRGTDVWDLSLVDPDNRARVDHARRADWLASPSDDDALLRQWQDGRTKQHVIHRLLQLRAVVPHLFSDGSYAPCEVSGAAAGHAIAFERCHGDIRLRVVVPRHVAAWCDERLQLVHDDLSATTLAADRASANWHSLFDTAAAPGDEVSLAQLWAKWPIAVLYSGMPPAACA